MSPVTFRRYVVTAHDYAHWDIVVEALSTGDAIAKAKAVYDAYGFEDDAFWLAHSDVRWSVKPLVAEVQR